MLIAHLRFSIIENLSNFGSLFHHSPSPVAMLQLFHSKYGDKTGDTPSSGMPRECKKSPEMNVMKNKEFFKKEDFF